MRAGGTARTPRTPGTPNSACSAGSTKKSKTERCLFNCVYVFQGKWLENVDINSVFCPKTGFSSVGYAQRLAIAHSEALMCGQSEKKRAATIVTARMNKYCLNYFSNL